MPLKIKCPTCKRVLSVPVQRIGAIVRCPVCENKLRVPKPQHAKPAQPGTRSKPSSTPPSTKRAQSPPAASAGGKPGPASDNLPRAKREPARPPEAKQWPDRSQELTPKKVEPPDRPPVPSGTPLGPEAAAPEEGSSKKEPPEPKPLDAPKPPPLPKSKRKQAQETPESTSGELRTEEPRPKDEQARQEPEESKGVAKAAFGENRWRTDRDGHPSPRRPPLPRKGEKQKEARHDSHAGTRVEPPPVPTRVGRGEAAVEAGEPETREPEREIVRGYEHDARRRWTVYYLGISLILAALFGAIPAVMDVVQHFRMVDSPGVSRWALALLLVSGIQLAYALYLVQLPDWSTVWVVSLVTLVMATAYAMFLGIAILAREDSQIIQLLDLADKVYGKKAAGWCLIMLSISSLLAYFSGRISVRWRRAYELVTRSATE